MKALFSFTVVWVCVIVQVANAFNATIDGIDTSSPDVGVNGSNVNDGDGIGDSDRSESASSTHTTTSSTSGNGNIHQNNYGMNDHTSYYYSNTHGESVQRMSAKYDDEQTYLDLFGERAKELLTQHIIPSTDAECRWDWRMGRCEPYCSCWFHFLWGDYHLGRSCRFRPNPPPAQFAGEEITGGGDEEKDETSWQEAWQEVWQSQMTEGTIEDASAFIPPMFPKTQQDAEREQRSDVCALPPESRYIQIIHQLTRASVVVDQYRSLKNTTTNVANNTIVSGKRHWKNLRQGACETVKRKVEERAKIRDQPVVLTRHGATWIRRVCGAGDGNVHRASEGDDGSSNVVKEDAGGASEAKDDHKDEQNSVEKSNSSDG